jgi:hypothetical protein
MIPTGRMRQVGAQDVAKRDTLCPLCVIPRHLLAGKNVRIG